MSSSSDKCTYLPGDGICLRSDCPKCCVRNYRDQFASDLPTALYERRPSRGFGRRHREPRLLRLLARWHRR